MVVGWFIYPHSGYQRLCTFEHGELSRWYWQELSNILLVCIYLVKDAVSLGICGAASNWLTRKLVPLKSITIRLSNPNRAVFVRASQ
jgi:Na+-transporting NADH:ubiquinone oxidoreductase subunit NqrB